MKVMHPQLMYDFVNNLNWTIASKASLLKMWSDLVKNAAVGTRPEPTVLLEQPADVLQKNIVDNATSSKEDIDYTTLSAQKMELQTILNSTREGKYILAYYIQNEKLKSDKMRSTLMDLIIHYAHNNGTHLGRGNCKKIVPQIIAGFPTEKTVI